MKRSAPLRRGQAPKRHARLAPVSLRRRDEWRSDHEAVEATDRRPKPAPPGDYKAEATRLHSLLVRHRAGGRCEKCGGSHPLECAHIVPRRFAATRTDEMNGLALCRSCHDLIDTDSDEKRRLAVAIIGEWDYCLLLGKARRGVKADEVFWRGEYDRLLPRARTLGLA